MNRFGNSRGVLRRHGFSLLETTIATAAGTFLLLLTVKVLHQTFVLSATANTKVAFLYSNSRLSRQFRDDVHDSIQATLDEDKSLRLMMTDGNLIVYRTSVSPRNSIFRETILEGTDIHQQEVFRLLGHSRCRFQLDDPSGFALLEIESSIPGERDTVRLELRVQAQIGRTHRINDKARVTP